MVKRTRNFGDVIRGMMRRDIELAAMIEKSRDDYGLFWKGVCWNYNLSKASKFIDFTGYELRWFGVAIPWTNIGIGLLVRRKRRES